MVVLLELALVVAIVWYLAKYIRKTNPKLAWRFVPEFRTPASALASAAAPSGGTHQPKRGMPTCQHCGGAMDKTVVSSGNCSGIVVALIVFCVGIIIFFAIPFIGWVLGPIISLGALFMGGKRTKVWKCSECGIVVNRA